MNIDLVEIERKKSELFFNIVNKDNNDVVGILFTVENHIAYEVYEEYRNQGIATDALKQITGKIDRPILEIKYDNMASKAVALKAGYSLVRRETSYDIYEISIDKGKSR